MDDFIAFARLIDVLRPWLRQVVVVGGWAHRLHRFHRLAHAPSYAPVRTKDADIACSVLTPLEGDIKAAMKAEGFEEEFSGEYTPPITQYRLGGDDQGFFAEFLAPLHGSGITRHGQPDVTVGMAGITAQKLRYIDLLLLQPWTVKVDKEKGIPVTSPADVMLANPVSYIIQKLLIQKYRRPEKKAQDALYIHDTLELFGGELPALRALWYEIRPRLAKKTARTVEALWVEQFGAVTDVTRNAARIPQDRTVTPDRLQATCAYGLGEIFR